MAGGTTIQDNYYIVKKGDTLNAITKKYNTTVSRLIALNPHSENANLIYPSTTIHIR